MLVGDFLAYIDVFSVLFLLGVLSRAATILFMAKQAMARVVWLANRLTSGIQRLDSRHRREGRTQHRKRPSRGATNNDDEPATIYGVAWA
jgi:hypothetical protein